MIGRHHLVLGTAAAAGTAVQLTILPWQQPGIFALALLAGGAAGLLPDLDTRQNHLRRGLGLNRRRRGWRRPLRWLTGRSLDLAADLIPHRTFTHWPLTALLLAGALRALTSDTFLAGWLWSVFLAGYLSHLLADSLTKAGVPLLAPLTRQPVRLLPRRLCVRTGGRAETLLVRFLLLTGLGWYAQTAGWLTGLAPLYAQIG